MKKIKNERKWIFWFSLVLAIVIIYKILDNFTGIGEWLAGFMKVIKPFFMAILLAYLLYIPSRKIEKAYRKVKVLSKHARGLAVLTTYILVVFIIAILINIILPTISESVRDLAGNLPGYYNNAKEYVNNLPEDSIISKEMIKDLIGRLEQIDVVKLLDADNVARWMERVMGIANGLVNAFITIVVSVYILLERTQILKFIKRLNSAMFSEKGCLTLNRYFIKGNEIFFKYISSQVLDAILVAIIMAIALSIMKVKYAILLGVVIGVFNLIPYFGAIAAVIIAGLITTFTGGIGQAIWAVIVMIILQQIDANIINPKIVGDALDMSKILIILGVTIGGAYFNVLGMFLGVPVIAAIKMMIDDYIERNEKKEILQE